MKKLLTILCLVLLSSCSPPPDVPYDKLVERNGITYEVNSTTPFTGTEIKDYRDIGSGIYRTKFKNGKQKDNRDRHYQWEHYYQNGQLKFRYEGDLFEEYYVDGQLKERYDRNGSEEYYPNGQLKDRYRSESGLSEEYYENGQLENKGKYNIGDKEGLWEYFDEDGNLTKTEEYKDGVLQE